MSTSNRLRSPVAIQGRLEFQDERTVELVLVEASRLAVNLEQRRVGGDELPDRRYELECAATAGRLLD